MGSAGKVWQWAGWKNRTKLVVEKWRFVQFLRLHQFAHIENSVCKYFKPRRIPQFKRGRSVSLKICEIKIRIWLQLVEIGEILSKSWIFVFREPIRCRECGMRILCATRIQFGASILQIWHFGWFFRIFMIFRIWAIWWHILLRNFVFQLRCAHNRAPTQIVQVTRGAWPEK